jgi:archaellum component FlaF (FlaF/FlaG flagellin family)
MTEIKNITPPADPSKKGVPIAMITTSIILAAALIFLIVMYFDQKNKMIEMETALTQEKDSLANELMIMVNAYDTLKTDNDSLNANLEKEKKRIIQLLSINASNVQLIKKYKSELTTMREIMKSYIVQIDSLNTRNKMLIAENTEIRQQMTQVQDANVELSKVKEELNSKVEIASVIQAKDIIAAALNKKRKETSKLNLLDKLRICFTLRENPIATAGPKEVFMRVIRPDSLIITSSPDNLFEYNGEKLIYSANRTADYLNQDIEMCIFLDNTGDFIAGNYSVELYLENNIIGRTNFMLSKR